MMNDLNQKEKTLIDILKFRSENQPHKNAYIFLENGKQKGNPLTYKELNERASAIAEELLKKLKPGDRALLLYAPGLEYICAFMGCLVAGIIAIPAYPPEPKRLNRLLPRLNSILKDAEPKVILTSSDLAWKVRLLTVKNPKLALLKWISTDRFIKSNLNINVNIKPSDVAFLQYTSGSTGNPKGVMVTHQNLIHNSETTHQMGRFTEDDKALTWLPLYHDMGLIGQVLLCLYIGIPLWIMSPIDFLKNPFLWLKCISDLKITLSGGPNFAFELCNHKVLDSQLKELDLQSWRIAFCGAEPIRLKTLHRFFDKFSAVNLKRDVFFPCYGLAESTVMVLGKAYSIEEKRSEDKNSIPSGQTILNDTHVIIVHPERLEECKSGESGEIWISSPSVCKGYWGKEYLTQEVFQATLKNDSKLYLRSGDIGFKDENELFTITGRLKDLIIINGKNHYPSDIEDTVSQLSPLIRKGCVVAFSSSNSFESGKNQGETESLVIVLEIKKNTSISQQNELLKKIQKVIFEFHEIHIKDCVLISAGELSKTTSGKLQRLENKKRYEENQFKRLNKKIDSSKISDTILSEPFLRLIKSELKYGSDPGLLEKMNENSRLGDLGLGSLEAISLSEKISKFYKIKFTPDLFFKYQTLGELDRFLTKKGKLKKKEIHPQNKKLENDPIVVVGIGVHFPDAESPEEFWKNLIEYKDSIKEAPFDRWNWEDYSKETKINFEKEKWSRGGYVEDIKSFDPLFFGISPREAISMDPQQRIFLQTVWHALEDAGISPKETNGEKIGLFVGASSSDYTEKHSSLPEAQQIQFITGNAHSMIANRISYLMNWKGPSQTVDTACSSSLVALHDALKSIENKDCEWAVVGGVNAILSPTLTSIFAKTGMLSPDGKCYTFDERAKGYVRGEGAGVVVLTKKSFALREGQRIYGIIRGSAVNHNGRTQSPTAPSSEAQSELILKAWGENDLSKASYIELHGTATVLGDPVEFTGLKDAFEKNVKSNKSVCYLGSVKTNIGHLEAAAGMAGLIKVLLALRNHKIPPTLHFKNLNPYISMDHTPFQMAKKVESWPLSKRWAGVSSFGFGGVNAHIVIEGVAESESHQTFPIKRTKFKKEKYYLNERESLHPFIDRIIQSEPNFVFDKKLKDSEFFLKDHVVLNESVLPGVAILEIILFLYQRRSRSLKEESLLIRKIHWLKPILLSTDKLSIQGLISTDPILKVEIRNENNHELHAFGEIEGIKKSDQVFYDLKNLISNHPDQWTKEKIYSQFSDMGLNYGESFQCIETLYGGSHSALAKINWSDQKSSDHPDFFLNPALLDAAFGVCVGIQNLYREEDKGKVFIPFSLDEARIDSPIKTQCYSLVELDEERFQTKDQRKYNIKILNEVGRCLASFKGLMIKSFQKPRNHLILKKSKKIENLNNIALIATDLSSNAFHYFSDHLVFNANYIKINSVHSLTLNSKLNNIIVIDLNSYFSLEEEIFSFLISIIKKINTLNLNATLLFIGAPTTAESRALFSSVGAFVTSLKSNTRFSFSKVIQFEPSNYQSLIIENTINSEILEKSTSSEIFYNQEMIREKIQFDELELKIKNDKLIPSPGDVVVVFGGTGAIGKVLIDQYLKPLKVKPLSVSRSEQADYRCDLSDRDALEKVLVEIRSKYQKIDGIFHCSGNATEKSFLELENFEILEILKPKMTGLKNCFELTQKDRLKYLVLFSSTSSFVGDFGGGVYAASNRFMDQWVEDHKLKYPYLKAIQWPLWEKGGMYLPSFLNNKYKEIGYKPLQNREALSFLNDFLKSDENSLAFFFGDLSKMRKNLLHENQNEIIQNKAHYIHKPLLHYSSNEILKDLKLKLSKILKITAPLEDHKNLMEYGVDSMMVMEFNEAIKEQFGPCLEPKDFFEYPKLVDLSVLIEQRLRKKIEIKEIQTDQNLNFESVENTLQILSDSQKALWFLAKLQPNGFSYNIPIVLKASTPLEIKSLKTAIEVLTHNHPILRVRFTEKNNEVFQYVHSNPGIHFEVLSCNDEDLHLMIKKICEKPFDLEQDHLLKTTLIEAGTNQYLVFVVHHIVFDGLSLLLFSKEFINVYLELKKSGEFIPIKKVPHFFSFIKKHHDWLSSKEGTLSLEYWKNVFSKKPEPVQLPTDRIRPIVRTDHGATVILELSSKLSESIKSYSKLKSKTPFIVFLGAFYILIQKISRQNEITIGTPVLGRKFEEYSESIGYFVNLIAHTEIFRNDIKFYDFIEGLQKSYFQHFKNQDVPFSKVVEHSGFERDPSRNPIFDICFVFQNMLKDPLFEKEGYEGFEFIPIPQQEGQFDLECEILEKNEIYTINLKYSTDLFQKNTILSWIESYQHLLQELIEKESLKIQHFSICAPYHIDKMIQINHTDKNYKTGQNLIEVFNEQVKKTPELVAIIMNEESLTYKEFSKKIDLLSKKLFLKGIRRGSYVPLKCERSIEMVIAIYAILKLGAAYVPIDPDFPENRIQMIRESCLSNFIITINDIKNDLLSETIEFYESIEIHPNDIAYIIHTSGSTGKPKGVMISHESALNRIVWMQEEYKLQKGDRVLQKTPFTFDVSVWEFFWPLLFGGTLVILNPEEHKDPYLLSKAIQLHQVKICHFVPSMLDLFLDEKESTFCKSLEKVFVSGEALQHAHQSKFFQIFKNTELHNLYGPTEASVDVSYWKCSLGRNDKLIPIGKAISNIQLWVVDEKLELLPFGCIGELCISGIGLAKGYLNQPELTSEKFCKTSFAERVYRTGDLVRQNDSGIIEYLGRMDHQVKIRGLRIELGEIESQLLKISEIKQCVVVEQKGHLIAYYNTENGKSTDEDQLKQILKCDLPSYMIPEFFVKCERFKFTSSGKIDRKELPVFNISQRSEKNIKAPQNHLESQLLEIYKECLSHSEIGVENDFFSAGGTSLLSIKAVQKIKEKLGVSLSVRAFYEHSTVKALVKYLDPENSKTHQAFRLNSEVSLSQDIQFDHVMKKEKSLKYYSVFFTGSTGFFGAYLLKELLDSEDEPRIYCLVRALSKEEGLQRVILNFNKYFIWKKDYQNRIHIVRGDLKKEILGIEVEEYEYLSKKCDRVIHNAAKVDFLMSYKNLKKENVLATEEIIRFCSHSFLKPLHYISTISVFASPEYGEASEVDESSDPIYESLLGGYAQSKWVAEKIVLKAFERGLRGVIYRPGTLTGDSESGLLNREDLFTRLLWGALQLKAFPEMNRKIDITPVNFASKAFIKLFNDYHQRESSTEVYHLINSEKVSHHRLFELLTSLNFKLKFLPYKEWVHALELQRDNALYPLLSLFKEEDEKGKTQAEWTTQQPNIKCEKTQILLDKYKVNCPEVDLNLIQKYVKPFLGNQ